MAEKDNEKYSQQLNVMAVNELEYRMPASISAVSECNRSQTYFSPNEIIVNGSETPSIIINAGTSYTDGPKSMLNFTMTVTAVVPDPDVATRPHWFAFGNNISATSESYVNSGGCALNLFTGISHKSKSGESLYQFNQQHHFNTTPSLFKKNSDYRKYAQAMMGGAQINSAGERKFPLYPTNTPVSFSIPLSCLSDFFNCAALIPPQLLAGSTLELTLNRLMGAVLLYRQDGTALATTGLNPLPTLTLSKLSLYLHQSQLYDSCSALVNSAANSNDTMGLQYAFNTVFATNFAQMGSDFTIDILLSAAKVSAVILKFIKKVHTQQVGDPIATPSISDLFGNDDKATGPVNTLNGGSLQLRLGSFLLPSFPITTVNDIYQQTSNALTQTSYGGLNDVDTLGMKNKPYSTCVAFNDYCNSTATIRNAGTGCTLFAWDLNRSNIGASGLSTNNSRQMSIQISGLSAAAQAAYQAVVFVEYMAVASCTSMNIVLNK